MHNTRSPPLIYRLPNQKDSFVSIANHRNRIINDNQSQRPLHDL